MTTDCEIRNTVQRLEIIEKTNEWFAHLLEGSEFLTRAIRETKESLQKNIAELDKERAKPEQSTNTESNEEFRKARAAVLDTIKKFNATYKT